MEPFALHDGDLELSVPEPSDVDRITELCQDPDIQRRTTVPSPYTRDHAEGFVHHAVGAGWERGSPTWAIRHRGDDGERRLVGMIDLHGAEHGRAEVGFWLASAARGAGIMYRAVGLVLDAGFDRFGLEVVQWRADLGNWPSWRVVWRHGFRKEGTVRRLGLSKGRTVDQWIGTLLRDDPREPVAPWDGPGGTPSPSPLPGRDPHALVLEFHERFGVPVADDGASVARERVGMRMALIGEELAELVGAVYGQRAAKILVGALEEAATVDDGTRDVVAAADALGDLVYVIYGMANECDIPLPEVITEIHRANMSKLGADGAPVHREDGKVLKGPGYRPPDIAGILATHRTRRG